MSDAAVQRAQKVDAEKRTIKLYSALDNYGGYPFFPLFNAFVPAYRPADLGKKDGILVIWGGADISPTIYGQKPNKWCGAGEKLSGRDELEVALAKTAIANEIPIIGVCRGAQLMCALSGGSLIQHVNGHGQSHLMETDEGKTLITSSMHHQMMFPWKTNHELIAWSKPKLSDVYLTEDDEEGPDFGEVEEGKREPEIVLFPETRCLAIQGHPEFMKQGHPFIHYCNDLAKTKLLERFLA